MSDFASGLVSEPTYPSSAEVVIQRGPAPGKRYAVTAVTNTIGRSPSNDVVINDPEISRRHAQIVQEGSQFTVEDLGSTNGTFVNGQRCAGATPLQHGDTIELGDTISLQFIHEAAVAQMAAEDTADSLPVQPPPPAEPMPANVALDQYLTLPSPEEAEADGRSNRFLIGCGLGLVLALCVCGILVIFLDSYAQGQYLYCGGLRPLLDATLGPFGFTPICP